MCLYTDPKHHPIVPGTKRVESKIAQCDIVVYKALNYYRSSTLGRKVAYSPYRGIEYRLDTLKTASNMATRPLIRYGSEAPVDRGLHAFTRKSAASGRMGLDSATVFPAIIPKGSRVFIGKKHEIASTALIVYKDIASLEAVHGKIAPAIKKADGVK